MIQRVQSVFMFFAVLSVGMIMYKAPVLIAGEEMKMLSDFMIAQIAALIAMFLGGYSILQFKNRAKQLLLNQFCKLALSISFFAVFIQKGEMLPGKGLFLFALPYLLLIIANRFIKKDDKLVSSADRIR
jgi:peptidoglycan/LPS O-acetylase OafA/YrhL